MDLCDFLETRFVEYAGEEAFWEDAPIDTKEPPTFGYTADGKRKGVFLHFMNDGIPKYVYAPLSLKTKEEFVEWEKEQIDKYDPSYSWIQTLYWKLETLSCVLIRRNRVWFEQALPLIESTWKGIVEKRKEGLETEEVKPLANNKYKPKTKEIIHVIKLNI